MNLNRYQIIELVELIVTGKFFRKENNILYYFQMDTVEGIKGKAVLLTFSISISLFMCSFFKK